MSENESNSEVEFSWNERLQGYRHLHGITTFLFDPAIYKVKSPERVDVTGAFRHWDGSMIDPAWQLKPSGGLWRLDVFNDGFVTIEPRAPFKFRINEGAWMEPPPNAPNAEAGNLVFAHHIEPLRLRAEILHENAIWFRVSGELCERPLEKHAYVLQTADGANVEIDNIIAQEQFNGLVIPQSPIDPTRVYYLSIPKLEMRSLCRFDGWFRNLYSDKPLGAQISGHPVHTSFRIFAPRATEVRLYLYESDHKDAAPVRTFSMQRDSMGVWEHTVEKDLDGAYYDFTVHGPADPGNSFYETNPVHISDPYARVSIDSFGRARVWHATRPAEPLVNGIPRMEDVIAYEVHVQDFTDLLPVDDTLRGTFPAMVAPGLKNELGHSIGFDYLLQLGINVVHLMPVQEFLHYPDSEWQAAFAEDPFMIEQGVNLENYQWGYRTTHALAIESRYRSKGSEPGMEREQFRDLVQAFHKHGIAVIIDLVPNHTGENMDARNYLFNFNVLDKPYYYRTDEALNHIGPFGNEIKTEDRPMVQRWLIDQCRDLINEIGIDGFRIDLAGQIDRQTLLRLRHELGPHILIYGEPWIPPSDPDVARNPNWSWYKADAPITFFQDETRNAFGSPARDPVDKVTSRGFAGGDGAWRDQAMKGLLNSFTDEVDPNRGINYLDIHDNWALADRYATYEWDGRLGVDEDQFKIAATLLFTSLGPIVIHGGTELMRSKGLAGLEERTKFTASGPLKFHGKHDTYNLRAANRFLWDNVGAQKSDGAACDYAGMVQWWTAMIAFRKSTFGQVFRVGIAPAPDYYHWLLPADSRLLGYIVAGHILVLINTSPDHAEFQVDLPAGTWRLIASNTTVDHLHGIDGQPDSSIVGSVHLGLAAHSIRIWRRID